MDFTPVIITQDNAEWAIRQNMLAAIAALASKVHRSGSRPFQDDMDANVQVVQYVTSTDDTDACTVGKFNELLATL